MLSALQVSYTNYSTILWVSVGSSRIWENSIDDLFLVYVLHCLLPGSAQIDLCKDPKEMEIDMRTLFQSWKLIEYRGGSFI